MPLEPKPIPRPEWTSVPREGCRDVEYKVLFQRQHLMVAMLRFGQRGKIDEHAAAWDIEVICLEGAGMTSVAGEVAPINAGEGVRWPAGQPHCLWTEESEMTTLMVEQLAVWG